MNELIPVYQTRKEWVDLLNDLYKLNIPVQVYTKIDSAISQAIDSGLEDQEKDSWKHGQPADQRSHLYF